MNIRLIMEGEGGKRFTLPVKGVDSIVWQMEGDSPTFVCRGPATDPAVSTPTLVELPAASVRTIYRDDEKAKAATPRVPKAGRAAPPDPPDPA